MSPRTRGPRCAVAGCSRKASEDLPLDPDTCLDIDVCGPCAREIEANPAGWRIRSLPITNSRAERTVVERVDG